MKALHSKMAKVLQADEKERLEPLNSTWHGEFESVRVPRCRSRACEASQRQLRAPPKGFRRSSHWAQSGDVALQWRPASGKVMAVSLCEGFSIKGPMITIKSVALP